MERRHPQLIATENVIIEGLMVENGARFSMPLRVFVVNDEPTENAVIRALDERFSPYLPTFEDLCVMRGWRETHWTYQ